MSVGEALRPRLDRIQGRALVVGGVGLAICLLTALISRQTFFSAYLVGFLFWLGIALGCVALTMLHHLTGGSWGLVIRRPLESGAMTLLPLALLFLPLAFGLPVLYVWAQPDAAKDPAILHKAAYLNRGAFLLRTGVYFVIWCVFAWLLNRWSNQQDRTEDHTPSYRLQRLSGPGLAIVFLTASFAAIDWVMSLEPDWYSTIYGAMIITGWGLATFASMIVVATLLSRTEAMADVATPSRLQDLGNLMLAFTMLWAYMSFSQFFIIWCGNLTEEIPWYLRRTRGGWQWFGIALIAFHFFAPFFLLLSREVKRRAHVLLGVASAVIVMHLVDLTWLVIPSRFHDPLSPYIRIPWLDLLVILAAVAGIGGIWVAVFVRQLKGRPLVPVHDPAAEHSEH